MRKLILIIVVLWVLLPGYGKEISITSEKNWGYSSEEFLINIFIPSSISIRSVNLIPSSNSVKVLNHKLEKSYYYNSDLSVFEDYNKFIYKIISHENFSIKAELINQSGESYKSNPLSFNIIPFPDEYLEGALVVKPQSDHYRKNRAEVVVIEDINSGLNLDDLLLKNSNIEFTELINETYTRKLHKLSKYTSRKFLITFKNEGNYTVLPFIDSNITVINPLLKISPSKSTTKTSTIKFNSFIPAFNDKTTLVHIKVMFFLTMTFLLTMNYFFIKGQKNRPQPLKKITNNKMEKFCNNYNLTKREREILVILQQGKTNKEISESLFISPETTKKHIKNIMNKTSASSRLEILVKVSNFN